MRVRTGSLVVALAAMVALAGCSGSGDDGAQSTSSAADVGEAVPGAGAPAPAPAQERGGAAQDSPAKAPDLSVDQRSIVYTGSLTVRVEDVSAAAGQATGIATGAGGFVGGDERSSGTATSGSATLIIRVPADKFGATVDQLSKLGKEQRRELATEDVTEETVDLDARIAVQQARVASGRKLLSQAKSLEDLVMLEREVATREQDLASLEAKKRRLADLTALSTVTVTLLGPAAQVADEPDGPPGFLAGLSGGWDALVASFGVVLTVLGALLPWLLLIGVPVAAVVTWLRRRRRSRTPAVTTS